jgi:hypothetical protein
LLRSALARGGLSPADPQYSERLCNGRQFTQVYGPWPFSGEIDIMEATGAQIDYVCGCHFGGPWQRRVNIAARSTCLAAVPAPATPGNLTRTCEECTCGEPNASATSAAPAPQSTTPPDTTASAPAAEPCNAAYHVWALEWSVRYVDGQPEMALDWLLDERLIRRVTSREWWTNVNGGALGERLLNPLAPFDQPFHIILNLSVGGFSFAGFPPAGASPRGSQSCLTL